MSYQPAIYRAQGGAELVLDSSGFGRGAGTLTVKSGGTVNLESGAALNLASGSALASPVQALGSSQTATTVTNFGLTVLTGTTTGPTFTMAAPVVGYRKSLSLSHSSSGATHRAVVRSNSTGVSFDTTGGNQVTLATSALRGITLEAQSTTKWRIVGVYSGASLAAPRTT